MLSLYDMIDDDEIVYGTYRVHVVFLVGQLISEIVLLSLTILAMSLSNELLISSGNNDQPIAFIVGLALWLIALVLIISAVIDVLRWYTKVTIVTSRRLIRREGFIQRSIVDITLHRLSQVDFTQSLFGRILNYGSMTISGGADLPPQELRNMATPLELRNVIEDARVGEKPPERVTTPQKHNAPVQEYVQPTVVPEVNSRKELSVWEQFEDLHQRGFLTDDELEAKRRMLFGEPTDSAEIQHTDGDNHDNDDGTSARAHSSRSGDDS